MTLAGEGAERGQVRRWRGIRILADLASIAVLVLGLGIPMAGTFFKWGQADSTSENRKLMTVPKLASLWPVDLVVFSEGLRKAFRDHFGFRTEMIYWQSYAKVHWLGAPANSGVIVGKDGWLFYAQGGSIRYFLRNDLFSPQEIDQWVNLLENRAAWLAKRNAHYVFVIAPAKETIYPEQMPNYLLASREDAPSRFDQLQMRLKESKTVLFVDLRPALMEAKKRERIYRMTDTHWNGRGAFVAYQAIIQAMQDKGIVSASPKPRSDFQDLVHPKFSGDLAGMLMLRTSLLEDDLDLVPHIGPDLPEAITWRNNSSEANADIPKLMVIGDSFLPFLAPFLAEQAGRTVEIAQDPFAASAITLEQPQVVIHELAERKLMLGVPEDKIPIEP